MRLKQVCNHPAHLLARRLARCPAVPASSLGPRSCSRRSWPRATTRCSSRSSPSGVSCSRRTSSDRFGVEVALPPRRRRDAPSATNGRPLPGRRRAAGASSSRSRRAERASTSPRAIHVIHFDRWWNPAVEDQATDRAYRIGQHAQRAGAQARLRRHSRGADRRDDHGEARPRRAGRRQRRGLADRAVDRRAASGDRPARDTVED